MLSPLGCAERQGGGVPEVKARWPPEAALSSGLGEGGLSGGEVWLSVHPAAVPVLASPKLWEPHSL